MIGRSDPLSSDDAFSDTNSILTLPSSDIYHQERQKSGFFISCFPFHPPSFFGKMLLYHFFWHTLYIAQDPQRLMKPLPPVIKRISEEERECVVESVGCCHAATSIFFPSLCRKQQRQQNLPFSSPSLFFILGGGGGGGGWMDGVRLMRRQRNNPETQVLLLLSLSPSLSLSRERRKHKTVTSYTDSVVGGGRKGKTTAEASWRGSNSNKMQIWSPYPTKQHTLDKVPTELRCRDFC